jgi:hypothetical protein
MSYLGKAPGAPGGVRQVYEFVATADQTTFSGVDRNGAKLTYEPGFANVFVGGVMLSQTDVTASSGSSIVLPFGLQAGKIVQVEAFGTFKVADAMPVSGGTFTGGVSGVTPAQFDNDTSLATTAFVQRALGNFQVGTAITSATTLTAADAGKSIVFGGAASYSVTLPLLSDVPNGAALVLTSHTQLASVTIQRQGSDVISMASQTATSFVLNNGDSAVLVKASGTWRLVTGSAQLPYSTLFGSSLAASGYQKLPSGLIVQWFSATAGANGGYDNAFPLAFTSSYYHVVAMHVGSDTTVNIVLDSTQPNPATTVRLRSNYSAGNVSCTCIAIGK